MDHSAYYREHPPRCTRGFAVSVADLTGVAWDGHGEALNPVFAVSCRCGSRFHKIHGYQWRNPDFNNMEVVLSPIELSCTACSARTLLVDTAIHGYDSELGNGSATVRAQGSAAEVPCEKCSATSLQVYIRFEYPEDLFDGEFDDFPGGKEDLFSWVSVAARCSQCGSLSTPVEFECA
jgi:hypothetical protein